MVAPPSLVRISLGEAVEVFVLRAQAQASVGRLSQATVNNYAADLADFVELAGAVTVVDDITGADVDGAIEAFSVLPDRRFVPARPGPRSALTVQRFRRSVSRFFAVAARDGWVQADPMLWSELRPKPRVALRAARTALVVDQAVALLTHGVPRGVPGAGRPHERNETRDRLLLAMLTVVGPRVSEVCSANVADFTPDGAGGMTWRITGKGGKVRIVPLSPWLTGLWQEYVRGEDRPVPPQRLSVAARQDASVALFRTGRGARLSARDVERMVWRAVGRVGQVDPELARDVTPHGLRHTAATVMLAAGWDVKVVAQMLGHSSLAPTSRYLDVIPGELAVAVADSSVAAAAAAATAARE